MNHSHTIPIAQNPNNAKAFAQRGESYRQMKRYPEALADFNRAIALSPNYAWAYAHRGETYYLIEQYKEALADFQRAIELNPHYMWAISHRGATYHRLNRYEEALKDLSVAIAMKPDYAWAICYRGQIYCLMNRYEEALADCDRAISLDKNIIPCWPGERSLLLSYMGRYAEAIVCCEEGLKENPDDWVTLYTLAVVKARSFGLLEAKAEIDRTRKALLAVENGETNAGVLYRLGGLAALEGDRDRALNYLAAAVLLENEPVNLAQRDLAWLELRDEERFRSLIP
ncbi:tetratricopeptide repeat protein [Aerosakkonema funiforme]|uniref:tetratricopeptide repeat protein n=1 Tax=Aerosakkonema funiforme TaxID=1246630 RepID=UPI0035BA4AAD